MKKIFKFFADVADVDGGNGRQLFALFIGTFVTLIIIFALIYVSSPHYDTGLIDDLPMERPEELTVDPALPLFTQIYDVIYEMRIEHPDIVMAQAIEESGHFKSALFREGHNLMGMKISCRRPTTAIGTLYGHARYENWRMSLMDYALWQSSYARKLTREEYFALLDSIYAHGDGYSLRLKSIIVAQNL